MNGYRYLKLIRQYNFFTVLGCSMIIRVEIGKNLCQFSKLPQTSKHQVSTRPDTKKGYEWSYVNGTDCLLSWWHSNTLKPIQNPSIIKHDILPYQFLIVFQIISDVWSFITALVSCVVENWCLEIWVNFEKCFINLPPWWPSNTLNCSKIILPYIFNYLWPLQQFIKKS